MTAIPPGPTETKRIAGRVWGAAFCGIGGGFLLGALFGGGFELRWDDLSTIVEILGAAPLLVLGAAALVFLAGRRVQISPVVLLAIAGTAIAGGMLLGYAGAPELAEEGPDDLSAWWGSTTGMLALALLGSCLLLTTIVSLRRYPATGLPEPAERQGLNEAIH